jgi:hypothetical protein
MKLFKSIKVIFIVIISLLVFFIYKKTNVYESYQSLYQRLKEKKKKRLEMEKEERKLRGKETDWGVDYHGSVRFDDYYMPQINLKPVYIFFDSDYYTY